MKHNDKERLSAAIDNELTPFETRQALRRLSSDPMLSGKWARYHLIGDVMRGELPDEFDKDLAARVMRRIEQEGLSVEEEIPPRRDSWLKTLGGLAIAASVAAASLLTLKLLTGGDNGASLPMADLGQREFPGAQLALPPSGAPVDGVRTVSSSLGGELPANDGGYVSRQVLKDPRLNSYLAAHAEYASRSTLMGRVRIVGFEAEK